jgi:hypothetical protein
MNKVILIIFGIILLIGGGVLYFFSGRSQSQGQAVLKINSVPEAQIFVDDKNIGKTPYEGKVASGEHIVKLVPEAGEVVTWENKINLRSNILTYINRDLDKSELLSGGEIITMEKISGKKAEFAVITSPDLATINLDGIDIGSAPLDISDKEAGSYELIATLANYKPRSIKIQTMSGYKLSATFQLASVADQITSPTPSTSPSDNPKTSPKSTPKTSPKTSPNASASASLKPKTSPPPKPYIEVLDTPTGYLNVRSEPSTGSDPLVKIYPGEFYPFVDEQKSGDNTWYEIKYNGEKTGWVSSLYASKFE